MFPNPSRGRLDCMWDWERRCIDRRKSDGKVRKDTIQHGLDVSHGPRVVTLPELLADVEEAVVVGRERGVLGAGLVLQTLPDVALAVRQEHERPTALVRVHPLGHQEPVQLKAEQLRL